METAAPDRTARRLLQLCLVPRERSRSVGRPQRREIALEAVDVDLVDVLGTIEVFQAVLAEVADMDPTRLVVAEHRRRRLREQDLSTARSGHDARRAMDAKTVVAVVGNTGLARVHS